MRYLFSSNDIEANSKEFPAIIILEICCPCDPSLCPLRTAGSVLIFYHSTPPDGLENSINMLKYAINPTVQAQGKHNRLIVKIKWEIYKYM